MRVMGHNVLAIIVAAIVIYGLEFVIYGMLIPQDQYLAMSGITAEQAAGGEARMPYGIIMPLLAAIGLSLTIKWRNAPGWMGGAVTGVIMAVLFGFSSGLYGYVYGTSNEAFQLVNLVHFVLCYAAAGAILGAWK